MNYLRTYLPFIVGLLSGLYFISLTLTGTHLEYFPGDLIDARFNNYVLEHGYLFFTQQTPHYWNAPFMYPEADVISYSDNLLGTVPFYSLFRALGADREGAFQYWFLLITIFNFSACFFFLNSLLKNAYAATLGAFVFTFSIALQSQMGHAQTFPRFAIPLTVWMLLLYTKDLKPHYFMLALLAWVYQMYCGIYLGLILLVLMVLMLLIHVGFQYRRYPAMIRQKKWWFGMLPPLILSVLLLLPLLLPYLERAKQLGYYPYQSIHHSLPTLASYFFSWNGSLCWDVFRETCIDYPAFWDHEIFTGGLATLGVIVALAFALWRWWRGKNNNDPGFTHMLRILTFGGVLLFIVFMRFGEFSLYKFLYHVPGYGSMRALQRIVNIELLFFGLALAYLFSLGTKNRKPVFSALLFILLLSVLCADNYVHEGMSHSRSKTESQERIQALVVKMKNLPKNTVVSYEPLELLSSAMDYQLDGMLAAQSLGLTTLNGYSATSPGGYGDYWVHPCDSTRLIWLERKNANSLAPVIIH